MTVPTAKSPDAVLIAKLITGSAKNGVPLGCRAQVTQPEIKRTGTAM